MECLLVIGTYPTQYIHSTRVHYKVCARVYMSSIFHINLKRPPECGQLPSRYYIGWRDCYCTFGKYCLLVLWSSIIPLVCKIQCFRFSFSSLLCAWAVRQASPFASTSILQEILCRNTAGLNVAQQNICIEVPAAMPILTRAEGIVSGECAWQFRREQWNCTGAESPIFHRPPLQGELDSSK